MSSRRLLSVDALRGLTVAAMLLVNDAGDWGHVHPWLEHAEWHGFAPPDLIFPLFLFIVGVSISLAPGGKADKVLWRSARIVLLGLALHAVAWLWVGQGREFRVFGVLQRIGICYAAGALVALHWRDQRTQWALLAGLLLGYWALLLYGGSLAPGLNLADRIDTALLGAHAYQFDAASGRAHEPEGLLSTLPSIASVLLGLRAGDWLRRSEIRRLGIGGLVALGAGLVWSLVLPLNKNLWTSSFVLVTGGAGMLLLAAAHALVDRRGWPALGQSLGKNAITAYALAWLAAVALDGSGLMKLVYQHAFVAPLVPPFEPWVPSAAYALVFTGLFWALMRGFDKLGWRISI